MNDFVIQVLSPQFWLLTSAKKIADGLMELKCFENKTLCGLWLGFGYLTFFQMLCFFLNIIVSITVVGCF